MDEYSRIQQNVVESRERLRKALNSSIRWAWFNVIGALVLVPLNLYFYIFGAQQVMSLVVAILWVALGAWGVYGLVTNYKKRWYHFGSTGRRSAH
jgi:hypothetical protein